MNERAKTLTATAIPIIVGRFMPSFAAGVSLPVRSEAAVKAEVEADVDAEIEIVVRVEVRVEVEEDMFGRLLKKNLISRAVGAGFTEQLTRSQKCFG
jgi:hypothetical protein